MSTARENYKITLPALLTVKEVAAYAKCAEETVRRACVTYQRTNGREGLRHYQRTAGGKYLFEVEDVRAWIGARS